MPLVAPTSKYGYAVRVLAQSHAAVALTGTLAETVLAAIAIPPNTIGLGQLEAAAMFSMTNNANNKVIRFRYGTASDASGTSYLSTGVASIASFQPRARIANRTTGSQVGWATGGFGYGTSTGAVITTNIDTTATTYLVIAVTLANVGDTVTLEDYVVRLLPAA
jgi:hypothetical protein